MHTYAHTYIYEYMFIYLCVYFSASLSLFLYIYIYIYIDTNLCMWDSKVVGDFQSLPVVKYPRQNKIQDFRWLLLRQASQT